MPEKKLTGQESTDGEDFLRLYSQNQLRLFGFVQSIVVSPLDAEEVLQEASVVLWRKWHTYDPTRDFLHWAIGVARLQAFKFLRERRRDRLMLSAELLTQIADTTLEKLYSRGQDADRQEALESCLKSLPDEDRKLIRNHYQDGKPVAELCSELGRQKSAVYDMLARIRGRLRRCVEHRLQPHLGPGQ